MMGGRQLRIGLTLLCLLSLPAHADFEALRLASLPPQVAIIIDDLGDRLHDGERAARLPGAVTCAVLPQTTYSHRLAEFAHRQGKEVMMHQPMQARSGQRMGPGGLSAQMDRDLFEQTLKANLASVPHARGINNHMGSLLTAQPKQMGWLMQALQQHGKLFFIDSTTTLHSVARKVARQHKLPNLRRHIFLDHDRNSDSLRRQFQRLIKRAQHHGSAVAIAHPYPDTLDALEQLLPTLSEHGVELVPVSTLIRTHRTQREQLWQASLSPSHQTAKSLKQ